MATVTVGCKLPHGIHMDLDGKRVTLNGSNSSNVIGGHGITENVDKEFFDKWVAQRKDSPMVKNGLVFAHERSGNAQAEAKEKAKTKTGFEGLDQDKPAPGITVDKDVMKQKG